MKPNLGTPSVSTSTITIISSRFTSIRRLNYISSQPDFNSNLFLKPLPASLPISLKPQFPKLCRLITDVFPLNSGETSNVSESDMTKLSTVTPDEKESKSENQWNVEVRNPNYPPGFLSWYSKFSLNDQASFLLAFIACTTSMAFTSLVIAAIPTLHAMGRAAAALSRLADTAREELPSTMAAIKLSGMEISDLTLELSDLSHEISDGITKSAQTVQAAGAGIRRIGSLARQHTIAMIQERANLPVISVQPVVSGAAKKTSRAVVQATRTLLNIISRGEFRSGNEEDSSDDGSKI
ncbi:hypothetical protein Nepgr_014923 [Nepenthes gracilis]|uniref:Uncharacterized protein n=1 Tax=Nepenthes gracilis TaxID=150966 RepID=A0AAD3SM65_NEPGR|nr:hypothetical protein Nepgr_014923 [Nepenthes gracilis]